MLKTLFQAPKVLLVVEESHVREEMFRKILSSVRISFKIIVLKPKYKDRFFVAQEFCAKLNKYKERVPLIIYVCLNTKNTPIELLEGFPFLIDIYDPLLGLSQKDGEREFVLIKSSIGCFCRDTRIHYILRKRGERDLLKKLHFAPDSPVNESGSQRKNNKAVSVGWLDGIEDNDSPLNKFFTFCRTQSIEPWVIPSRFQKNLVKKKKDLLRILPKTHSDYRKILGLFSFGLVQPCWDRQGDFLYPEWYLARASSSRMMDYIGADLTPVLPKYLRFQKWIARKGSFEPVIFDRKIKFDFKIKKRNTSKTISEFCHRHQEKIAMLIESIYKKQRYH
jgi:hypothetical protein